MFLNFLFRGREPAGELKKNFKTLLTKTFPHFLHQLFPSFSKAPFFSVVIFAPVFILLDFPSRYFQTFFHFFFARCYVRKGTLLYRPVFFSPEIFRAFVFFFLEISFFLNGIRCLFFNFQLVACFELTGHRILLFWFLA